MWILISRIKKLNFNKKKSFFLISFKLLLSYFFFISWVVGKIKTNHGNCEYTKEQSTFYVDCNQRSKHIHRFKYILFVNIFFFSFKVFIIFYFNTANIQKLNKNTKRNKRRAKVVRVEISREKLSQNFFFLYCSFIYLFFFFLQRRVLLELYWN